MTFKDLCDKLKLLVEVTLVELLEIRSEDIVERFIDEIEEMADVLEELLDDTD